MFHPQGGLPCLLLAQVAPNSLFSIALVYILHYYLNLYMLGFYFLSLISNTSFIRTKTSSLLVSTVSPEGNKNTVPVTYSALVK